MHELVLIEKFSPSSDCWLNLIRDNTVLDMSVEEIIKRYQGFEGELVDIIKVKGNQPELEGFISRSIELKNISDCLLLHVISGFDLMPEFLREKAVFVGYDIGACEEEKTIYSSIFNEILFGGYKELILYKHLLNENFLFPHKNIAEEYVLLHNQMSAEGKNVEDYMEIVIYEIWKHKE